MEDRIRVSCQKDNLREIRQFVSKKLQAYQLPDVDKNLIIVAIDEVCSNLMNHSHQFNPNQYIEIAIQDKSPELFICRVHDWGKPFNIIEYQTPPIEEIIKEKKSGGMGLILVKKIMDKIELDTSQGHTIYTFYKSLASANQPQH
ncbi:MAG: ATP-binding protein [Flammeovirgaceae bacterium]